MKPLAALVLALGLPGCATPPDSGARAPRFEGRCDAAPAQRFLGRFGSSEIAAQARDAAGAKRVRWLWPGTIVTMEYDPGRLDITLSRHQVIHAVRCG